MCCHTEIEVADQTFYLTQPQYTDTGPTSPNADPVMPGGWKGSHWSANFKSLVWLNTEKSPQVGIESCICRQLNHYANEAVESEDLHTELYSELKRVYRTFQ